MPCGDRTENRTARRQPLIHINALLQITYLLNRREFQLSRQSQVSNGIHSFIIHFLVQWLVVTLIRSEIRNPNFLIQSFLELRLALSLEMWHHRLIVLNLNFCFIEKINLKIISYALNDKNHLTMSENEMLFVLPLASQ